jgi:L-asparagine transporter-like permease
MVGSVSRFLLVPYAYLIVKLLFINKANNSKNVTDFLNIKKKLTVEVTFINIIATLIEMIFLQHTVIWLLYTAFVLLFLKVLKTKKENIDDITDKNIKNYFNKKIK